MQKSFSARLEALEALEALETQQKANEGPLIEADCAALLFQIALTNVALRDAHHIARAWDVASAEHTAEIDAAIARCNAMLALHPAPPLTTAHLAWGLARHVEESALPSWIWGLLAHRFPVEESDHENVPATA